MGFGTMTTYDELAGSVLTVPEFNFNRAFDAVEDLFNRTNELVQEQVDDFVETTTDAIRNGASPDTMTTQELSELGTPNPQKITAGQQIGFPLRKFGAAWQATDDAIDNMLANELAAQAVGVQTADLRRVQERIRNAFYSPTNYSFTDRLVARYHQYPLPVKALANADTYNLPIGPNGETFTAHNHYLATVGASVAQSDYDRLIDTVMEHFNMGSPRLIINSAQQTAVAAFTGFAPSVDLRIVQPYTSIYATGGLDVTNPYNRKIGIYRGTEVYVKPWAIAGYPICYQFGVGKPLVMREKAAGSGGLRLKWDSYLHPLRAKVWIREFDMAVYNRVSAAVLDTTHQTTYVVPTIPAA